MGLDAPADLVLQLANADALESGRIHLTTEISLGLDPHTHARCTACCPGDQTFSEGVIVCTDTPIRVHYMDDTALLQSSI